MESLLRLNDVQRRTGLRKSKIYALVKSGEFPKAVQLTERSVAWPESEVTHWIHAKIAESRQGQPVAA